MSNGCPVCAGLGQVLALGACRDPIPVPCPECAGLAITPASADDAFVAAAAVLERVRYYTVAEITALLLAHPALPAAVGD